MLRDGEDVVLDLVDPGREFVERARLGQHGGGDGARRGGRDDLGRDPLDADEVLEDAHLEGTLGAAARQDERGRAGMRGARASGDSATARRPASRGQPPAAALTTSTREPARAGVVAHSERGTTQRSTATATPLGSSSSVRRGHEVGDGRPVGHGHRLAVDAQRDLAHAGASASMSGATGRWSTRSTTAAAVSGASRIPLR